MKAMKPHHNHRKQHIDLKSLRTRFALRFLTSLKKIHLQQNKTLKTTHPGYAIRPSKTHKLHNHGLMVGHRVKMAAYASMASAVGPRRAWTRAVLRRSTGSGSSRRAPVSRAQKLRRLVPGGEAMDMESLLDETAHYISCLSTQVRVMRCILNYCSSTTHQVN